MVRAAAEFAIGAFPVQEHLISYLHALDTSGSVIHTGTHDSESLVQPKSCGEGSTCCRCTGSSLIDCSSNMLKKSILCGWYSN